jgi:protein-disulfide isomerase
LLDTLVEQHAGKIRLVFKHFPLSMHQYAEHAARAAVAAHLQGKFWPMHAALFENQMMLSEATIENLAKESGLDLARFKKDVTSEAVADAVNRDRKQGEGAQIASTPTLFINGRKFPPSPDFEQDLREWIELEIELTGPQPTSSAP